MSEEFNLRSRVYWQRLGWGLLVGCMMVAVPATVVPIPLALAVIGIVVIGLPLTNAIPVIMASLIAFSIVRGLVMVGGGREKQAAAGAG